MSSSHRQDRRVEPTRDTGGDDAPVEFLQRWSRRKSAAAHGLPEDDGVEAVSTEIGEAAEAGAEAHEPVAPGDRLDPRTGKRFDDLTDADLPDPDTLDESSDLRAFMARNISPSLRIKALTRVFHSAKYNKVCLCAEYADDYTSFEPLGDVVPHDLKAAVVREAGKLRAWLLESGEEISPQDAEARVLREMRARPETRRAYSASDGALEPQNETAQGVEAVPERAGRSAAPVEDGNRQRPETDYATGHETS